MFQTSFNSSIDDDDDDYNFYNNPAAQFNKIKEQKEKEAAMKMKLLQKQIEDEEESIDTIEDVTKSNSDKNTLPVLDAVIEITDSQSPKPSYSEDTYEEIPSNRRATRNSTRRGRGRRSINTSVVSPPQKKRGRKSSLDKGLEKLVEVASKLKAAKHNNLPAVLNDSPLLIDSDDGDDTEEIVNVKVVWRCGDPHSFPIVKKKDIGSIYEFFAKRENVGVENILLSKKDKVLSPHCTPLSIDYKVTDILEGGILQDATSKPASSNHQDKDCIEVKVQQKNVKKPLLIQLHKSNDMHILAKKVASELGIDVDKLKFNFDGDTLDLDETVESLDLDGGECFDLVVSS